MDTDIWVSYNFNVVGCGYYPNAKINFSIMTTSSGPARSKSGDLLGVPFHWERVGDIFWSSSEVFPEHLHIEIHSIIKVFSFLLIRDYQIRNELNILMDQRTQCFSMDIVY